ncbi:hypothetical protein AB9K26_08970 [Psychroserpens sp. XS_ASV72]|uniref:hypothetical protein n=1 Tax=Psychroserpens sp. XS_ASV72 TaxID=3241293 RepID=UPI0035157A10
MKKFIFVLAIAALAFSSCNHKGSSREQLQNAIEDFSKKQTTLENISYFPENYTEVQTDSLIANSFKVSIKNYSIMDKDILLKSSRKHNEINLEYHRVFESEIKIVHENKTILETIINAQGFKQNSEDVFWNDATLEHVWVNQQQSNKDQLFLNISFLNPKSKAYKLYEFVVFSDGNKIVELKEAHS